MKYYNKKTGAIAEFPDSLLTQNIGGAWAPVPPPQLTEYELLVEKATKKRISHAKKNYKKV